MGENKVVEIMKNTIELAECMALYSENESECQDYLTVIATCENVLNRYNRGVI